MTPEQFYEQQRIKGLTEDITCNDSPNYNLPFYQEIFRLMQEYANLQKPEWIPINSPKEVKGITDSAFVTYKTANGVRYVIEVAHLEHIYLYTYIKDKPIAYMIKEYPKSYRL